MSSDDEAKQLDNEDKAGGQLNEEEKDTVGKNKGRRGDARMHRAVAAKIADPSLSLFEALIKGGFSFPDEAERSGISDSSLVDSDNVLLSQRKNQLSRRIRNERKKRHNQSMVNMLKDNQIPASAITNSHHRATQPTAEALQEYMYRSVGYADSNPFLANELLQIALRNNQQHHSSHSATQYGDSSTARPNHHPSLRHQFGPLAGGFINNGAAITSANAGYDQFNNTEGAGGAFYNMQNTTQQHFFSTSNGATSTRNLSQDSSQHQIHPYFWGGSRGLLQNVHDRGHGGKSNLSTQHQAGIINSVANTSFGGAQEGGTGAATGSIHLADSRMPPWLDAGEAAGFNELLHRKNPRQMEEGGGREGGVLPSQTNHDRGQEIRQLNISSFSTSANANARNEQMTTTDSDNGETMQLRNQGGIDTDDSPITEVVAATVEDTTTNLPHSSLKDDKGSENDHQMSASTTTNASSVIDDDESMMVSEKSLDHGKHEVVRVEHSQDGSHVMDGVSTSSNQDAKFTTASKLYNERRLKLLQKCLIGVGFDPNEVDSELIRDLDDMIRKD